jgi:hypothetical protein
MNTLFEHLISNQSTYLNFVLFFKNHSKEQLSVGILHVLKGASREEERQEAQPG